MRIALAMLGMTLITAGARAEDRPAPPSTQPDQHDWLSAYMPQLFEMPREKQQIVRERMEMQEDLPQLLASLLSHEDPDVRRTCLVLIRDDYGDRMVVGGVQELLSRELAQPGGGDVHMIAACCQILAEWPQWDSIPLLLGALKPSQVQPAPSESSRPRARPSRPTWRQADLALRLVSGHWPLPEPAAAGPAEAVRNPAVATRQQATLNRSWTDWWMRSSAGLLAVPQLRLSIDWFIPLPEPRDGPSPDDRPYTFEAFARSLWIRPTAGVQVSRFSGLARGHHPMWQWADRSRSVQELHINAIQADAIRRLHRILADGRPGKAWLVPTPDGVGPDWTGYLELTDRPGRTCGIELVPAGTADATRPPTAAADALAELLTFLAES